MITVGKIAIEMTNITSKIRLRQVLDVLRTFKPNSDLFVKVLITPSKTRKERIAEIAKKTKIPIAISLLYFSP